MMIMSTTRTGSVSRTTKETDIQIALTLEGTGVGDIHTGIPFFDHMLISFTRYGFFDLDLQARGDLDVDYHHTVEDVGICLGEAFDRALGTKEGIQRFGHTVMPMDEALVSVTLAISAVCTKRSGVLDTQHTSRRAPRTLRARTPLCSPGREPSRTVWHSLVS